MRTSKKIVAAIRDILRSWHNTDLGSLPLAYQQTLIGIGERECRSKRPDLNWKIQEAFIGLRDNGLLRVVDETVAYYFPEVTLTLAEREWLLRVAQNADRDGLVVRAMIEEAFRSKQVAKRIED